MPEDRSPPKKSQKSEREARLADALRRNLRRRKEQSRGRAEPPAPDKDADGTS